jgi:hypothetical protein
VSPSQLTGGHTGRHVQKGSPQPPDPDGRRPTTSLGVRTCYINDRRQIFVLEKDYDCMSFIMRLLNQTIP